MNLRIRAGYNRVVVDMSSLQSYLLSQGYVMPIAVIPTPNPACDQHLVLIESVN
jgi:hypothetical protein